MSQLTLQDALTLGLRHHNAGELAQAEQIYTRILQQAPNQPDALHLLGVIAHQVRRYDVAIQYMSAAVNAGLRTTAAYNNLGEAFRMSGQLPQAEQCYREAIRLGPEFAAAHSNLGIVLHEGGRVDEASAAFGRALRIEPSFVEALNNHANLLLALGRLQEAEATLRRAIEIRPGYAEAHNNLATALERMDRYDEALAEYKLATELCPDFAEATVNLGSQLQKMGGHAGAIAMWEKTLQTHPDHADAKWNIALSVLAKGDYHRGWELYETRFQCKHSRGYRREYPVPRWDGSELTGKTILLYPEQGFGDVLQFARFIPQVAQRGVRVILECHRELVELMRSVDGVSEVVPAGAELPAFDTFLPLLSVPRILKTTPDDLADTVPYLRATEERQKRWADRFTGLGDRKKVGIVWAGKAIPDPKRTCPVEVLAPLFETSNIAWFSLQTGDALDRLADVPHESRPTNLGPELNDFADTAAALSHLDLLITIDTATAHLAGGMGVRTWTMIPFAPDWRWMYDREDSPWYPTMRLFRQPRLNDWPSVVQRLKIQLLQFVSQ